MDETEVTGLPKEKKNFSSHLQLKANDCRGFIPPDLSKRLQKWKKWQIKKTQSFVCREGGYFLIACLLTFSTLFVVEQWLTQRSRGIINIKVFFSVQSAVHCTLLTHAQTTEQAATGGLVGCLPTDAALMKRCFGDICYRSSSLWRRADSHTLCDFCINGDKNNYKKGFETKQIRIHEPRLEAWATNLTVLVLTEISPMVIYSEKVGVTVRRSDEQLDRPTASVSYCLQPHCIF